MGVGINVVAWYKNMRFIIVFGNGFEGDTRGREP
jgi:hypothetical protein